MATTTNVQQVRTLTTSLTADLAGNDKPLDLHATLVRITNKTISYVTLLTR